MNVDAICDKSTTSPSPLPAASGATVAPPGSRIPIQKGEFPPSKASGKADKHMEACRMDLFCGRLWTIFSIKKNRFGGGNRVNRGTFSFTN